MILSMKTIMIVGSISLFLLLVFICWCLCVAGSRYNKESEDRHRGWCENRYENK